MQKSLIKNGAGTEWVEFISRLGLANLQQARSVFFAGDYSQLPDLSQKALYTAGRGKTLSLEGNLPGSKISFDEALMFAENRNAEAGFPMKDDILAYVNYELAGFLSKYGEAYSGLSLYRSARRLANSNDLINTIEYQLFAYNLENNQGKSAEETLRWIDYFANKDMHIMRMIAMRRYSTYFRKQKEYDKALFWIEKALAQAYEHEHEFVVDQFRNVKGYILIHMGAYSRAREIFESILPSVQGHFLKSAILENITLSYFYEQNFEAAAEYIDQAIANSRKYEVLSQLPDECLFMGDLQRDRFQHPELATQYYEWGYLAALKLAEFGFALRGDRLKVVQAYEQRPRTGYSLPEPAAPRVSPFAFSLGHTWKEIQDLFHFNLLKHHLATNEGATDLPTRLGLKPTTYYAIKRRLTTVGYNFDAQDNQLPIAVKLDTLTSFKVYVGKLEELDWAGANSRFETEIIEYLFKHAGYQKTRLAEDLDISYPTVLQKTKSLSQSE